MNETMYLILIVASIAICTFLLRLCPFVIFGKGNETPKNVLFIGNVLPTAMIAILIIYCLKGDATSFSPNLAPQLISCAVAFLLHYKFGSTLLSIWCSTALYMILIRTVFI